MTWEYEGCTIIINDKGKFVVNSSENIALKNLESVSLSNLKAKILKHIPKQELFVIYKGSIKENRIKINHVSHYPLGGVASRLCTNGKYLIITKKHPMFIKIKNALLEHKENFLQHRKKMRKLESDFNNNVKYIDINIE